MLSAIATASAWLVAGAEDDRLLLGAAGREEEIEQVVGHRLDAVGQQELRLERARLVALARLGGASGARRSIASARVVLHEVVLLEAGLALGERAALEEDVAPDDLAGGEVAVLDALADVVLVDGLAEVAEVVGADRARPPAPRRSCR